MESPLISVVIPYYNRSAVISRAVKSALNQTYKELEVVIVDDASTEDSAIEHELVQFHDQRIRLIKHAVNKGGGAARNTGVSNARGKYIAFLDSDDEWMVTKLERQMVRAESLRGFNWLIYSQSEVLTSIKGEIHSSIMPAIEIGPETRVGDYLFSERGWLPTSSMFLPKSLAESTPFNPDLRRHQDYDLLLRLEAQGCKFLMVPEPLTRVHWEDFHTTGRGLNLENSLRFLSEYRQFLSPKAQSGFINQQIVTRLLMAGRRTQAIKHSIFHVRPWHLRMADHSVNISHLLFGDARIATILAELKKSKLLKNN